MNKKILLASQSKYRKSLLAQLKIDFTVSPSDIDETPLESEDAITLVKRLSYEKAVAKLDEYPNHIIIGSDQVAEINGKIVGKPKDKNDAKKTLMACKGKDITFYTGLCVLDGKDGIKQEHIEPYTVRYRDFSEAEIDSFLDKELLLSCAGSIDWQGMGISLLEKLVGNDPNALTGLPLIKLCEFFRNIDINIYDTY